MHGGVAQESKTAQAFCAREISFPGKRRPPGEMCLFSSKPMMALMLEKRPRDGCALFICLQMQISRGSRKGGMCFEPGLD
jgi:hypothetical protein